MSDILKEYIDFYPEYILDYIKEVYVIDPILFKQQLRKAENNSRRNGIRDKTYNLWIAANNTDIRLKARINSQIFTCYYCHLELNKLETSQIRFEHFIPKLHKPSNIVSACEWCDSFKKDRLPEDFVRILEDSNKANSDVYTKTPMEKRKLIEFAPLVACRSVGLTRLVLDNIINLAQTNYSIDLSNIEKGYVRWKYYELYRKKWIPIV